VAALVTEMAFVIRVPPNVASGVTSNIGSGSGTAGMSRPTTGIASAA
jgi:hypothetical protein